MRFILFAVTAAFVLSGCSPKTEPAAGEALPVEESSVLTDPEAASLQPALDPTQLDLSKIALAMRIPSAFRAYDDGAFLQINVTSPRLGVDIAETFPLTAAEGFDSQFLASENKDGFTIWTYATKPDDGARLAALSAELTRLKAEAPGENELTFGAIAPGCWNEPEQTPGSLARTLYIRVMPEEDFQVFVTEQVLAEGDLSGIETYWGACK